MVNPNKEIINGVPVLNISTLYQEFSVELTPNLLLQLMSSYELKASDVAGDYIFDFQKLEQLVNSQPFTNENCSIEQLTQYIRLWPKQLSWLQFNHHINNLLLAWLNDYKLGTNLDSALLLARTLTLKSPITDKSNQSKDISQENSKFNLFLMHLLSRATNQFDQYKINYIKNYDLETGLPNQQLMTDLLNHHLNINHSKQNIDSVHIGIVLINLNINIDKESHLNNVSSKLMLAAIQTIKQHLNNDAILFRVGPIELAIVIERLQFPAQLNLITSNLVHAFESELPLENITLILKPYFGGVSSLEAQSSAISAYDCAKLALHHAMINNYQIEIYNQHTTTSFSTIHQLDEAIINALQQNELEIYLQPIITLPNEKSSNDTCISAEILLRWNTVKWPSLSPIRLVDTIYRKGFGKIFIRWLINNACRRCAELRSTFQRNISLTINLCGKDLIDEDIAELLAQSIALWEIPAENLVIEITESDLLMDEEKVAQVIDRIVMLGCKLALDDFGTGYSSMARLRNMPIDLVKIDQSFVRHISSSSQDREIVQSVVKLAHSLGKEVVAEGVEDLACLKILKEMKCEKIQGYFYAKPMSFDDFASWLIMFEKQSSLS